MAWDVPPIAVCTECRAPLGIRNIHLKQRRCGRRIDGERCRGSYEGSTLKPSDWAKCVACGETGFKKDVRCKFCQGSGWVLTRTDTTIF
jgi:hypothetical protein